MIVFVLIGSWHDQQYPGLVHTSMAVYSTAEIAATKANQYTRLGWHCETFTLEIDSD